MFSDPVFVRFLFFFTLFSVLQSKGQGCFEINSILVDACGTPEGQNEMVRFTVGENSLLASDLVADWPNNSFQGICQDATTASHVEFMNSTVVTCGLFVEPSNSIIPPNAEVLFITSTDFDPTAHSYEGLTDTIYVIFQCSGNTAGHFANWTNPCDSLTGERTLLIQIGNCIDSVTYNKCSLINQFGAIGGSSSERDGAGVNFTSSGSPDYFNDGCSFPYIPVEIQLELQDSNSFCINDTILINAQISGSLSNIEWISANGFFENQAALSTSYNSETDNDYYVYFSGLNGCNEQELDSILITFQSSPSCIINLGQNYTACNGDVVVASAITDSLAVIWNTGDTTNSIAITETGYYGFTATSNCGTCSDSVFVNFIEPFSFFVANTLEASVGEIFYFTNLSLFADTYTWIVENDNINQGTNLAVQFDEPGQYSVLLEAVNSAYNCIDTFEIIVTVIGDLYFNLPNIITPNNDGSNDFFGIWTNNNLLINTTILNRWGNLMYESALTTNTNQFTPIWDGKIENTPVTDGIYFYEIKYNSPEGPQKLHGNFTVVH